MSVEVGSPYPEVPFDSPNHHRDAYQDAGLATRVAFLVLFSSQYCSSSSYELGEAETQNMKKDPSFYVGRYPPTSFHSLEPCNRARCPIHSSSS
jgi:hypothetical protein